MKTKLCNSSLPPEEKLLQMSFADIGLISDVFQYLKWTFPLAIFTDYYETPRWPPAGLPYNFSNLALNTGSLGAHTRLIGR